MIKYIALIIAFSAWSAEGLQYNNLDKVALNIGMQLSTNNINEVEEILRNNWYAPNAEIRINELKEMIKKDGKTIAGDFGNYDNKISVLGYVKFGRIISVIVLSQCSLLDLPIKITFVNRDNRYYICGLQYGSPVFYDAANLADKVIGSVNK